MAVVVFVKFVAKTNKSRHEFHELTRIKFSTASEGVHDSVNCVN